MSETSNLTELSKRLKESKDRELQEAKQIGQESLNALSQSLRESLETELRSIEGDMLKRTKHLGKLLSQERQRIYNEQKEGLAEIEEETLTMLQALNKVKTRYWIVPLVVAATLIIGLVAGTWGLGVAISGRVETLNTLNTDIDQAEKTLEAMKLMGVYMDKEYIAIPRGYTLEGGYETKDKREAYKLIRKR